MVAMKSNRGAPLFGSNVVELLLPHRRPLLMVDSVEEYEPDAESEPRLVAGRCISVNEAVFDGHFPSMHLWPGIFTIEGMGQSCQILFTLLSLQEHGASRGEDRDRLRRELRNLERGFSLKPGFDPQAARAFRSVLEPLANGRNIGLASAVDVKLLAPVFAGSRLLYEVRLTHRLVDHVRFDVSARVGSQIVARGSMSAVTGFAAPLS